MELFYILLVVARAFGELATRVGEMEAGLFSAVVIMAGATTLFMLIGLRWILPKQKKENAANAN